MVEEKYGLVGWEEETNTGNNQNFKRDEFMRLLSGDNELRIITQPFQYWSHKWKKEGASGFGKKIYCSKFNGSCPLCALGDKPKKRWYVGIIDRATSTYKILDMGSLIYQGIQGYSRDEKWGDPGQYDFNITVNRNGGPANYYQVRAQPKVPLSDDDIKLKQDADLDALKRRCNPPKPEDVQKQLDREGGEKTDTPAVAVVASTDSTDSNDDFPPANVE